MHNESFVGLGEFRLASHFAQSLKIPEDEMLLIQTSALTDLISSLKQTILDVPGDVCHTIDSCTQSTDDWDVRSVHFMSFI